MGVFLSILFKLSQITVLFSLFNIIIIKFQYLLINLIIKFLKMSIEGNSPYCYYHPNSVITNFCLYSQCLLPLCQLCVQIHRKENRAGQHMSRILAYKQAKNIAMSSIRSQKQHIIQNIKQFENQYNKFSAQLITQLQKLLKDKKQKILQQNFNYSQKLKNFQQKINSINNNCLKQLINHYEYGKVFVNNIFQYQFQISQMAMNSFVEGSIFPKKLQQSVMASNPSFSNNKTQHECADRKCQDNISFYTEQAYSYNQASEYHQNKQSDIKQKTKQCELDEIEKQNLKVVKSPSFQKNENSQRKKARHGIFVASSPNHHHRKTLKDYSTQIKSNQSYNQNHLQIYQPQTDRNVSKNFDFRQVMQTFSEEAAAKLSKNNLLRPQSAKNSSRLSEVKKYQFPNKVLIIEQRSQKKESGGRQEIQNSGTKSQLDRKEKDWKGVVNKSDVSSRSSSSRLILKAQTMRSDNIWSKNSKSIHNQCLNPQEMRELILKKRNTQQNANFGVQRILQDKLVMNQNTGHHNIYNQYKQRN